MARQANPHILIMIMTKTERPEPPEYFDRAMGRTMLNAADPDYIKRVQAWERDYSSGMLKALIGEGTSLKSVPKGMEGPHPIGKKNPEEMDWVREYRNYGFEIYADLPSWRYLTWVLFKAAVTEKDTQLIGDKVKALSGVKEADVQAAESFPDGNKAG